jgi:hypothetical protein
MCLAQAKENSMSIFGKKSEAETNGYGIADLIRLLRTLPVDQHAELVVRVIRTTLESVNVHASNLIQDALRHEQKFGERLSSLQTQIQDLTKQIDTHREEVRRLEADLAETTNAKERLLFAEQAAPLAGNVGPSVSPLAGMLPVPLPPPQKSSPPRSPDQHHNSRS